VYDVEVEQVHAFYAGGILVHNCPLCDGYESRNPWTMSDIPHCPAHLRCRCNIRPRGLIPAAQYRPFLAGLR
jgi:hypothetical protein